MTNDKAQEAKDKAGRQIAAIIAHTLAMEAKLPHHALSTARAAGNTFRQLAAGPDYYVLHHEGLRSYCLRLCERHSMRAPVFMAACGWDDFEKRTRGLKVTIDVDHHARDLFRREAVSRMQKIRDDLEVELSALDPKGPASIPLD